MKVLLTLKLLSNSISEMVMFQRSVLFLQISCFITHVVFADMLFFSMQVVFKFHLLIYCPQYIYLVIHIYLGYSWRVIILLTLVTIQNQPSRGFLRKGALKICRKFTGEHPYRSAISIKLQSNFIEITLRHGCTPVNLVRIFWAPFLKNISERVLPTVN